MLGWERDLSGRLQRTAKESQPNMEDTEESNNHNNRPRPPMQDQRIVREFLNPPRLSTPSCFMLPPNHDHVTIRPQVVSQLSIFRGMENENPYSHIKEFEDIVSIFQEANTPLEIFCKRLFPLSLKDKAKTWLNSLRPYSIRNWGDLQSMFLQKFFPTHKTSALEMGSRISRLWRMRNFLHVGKDSGRLLRLAPITDLTTGC